MIKKALPWIGVAFVVFFIYKNPNGAADVVLSIGGGIVGFFESVGTFFARLAS